MMTATPGPTAPRSTRSRRTATALTVVALAATGLGLSVAAPAQAADCTLPVGKTASVQSITVAPLYVRTNKADFPIPVTVAVCDPAGLVKSGDAILGVKLLTPADPRSVELDYDFTPDAPVGAGDLKTYSFMLVNFYEANFTQQVYGTLDVGAAIYDVPKLVEATQPLDVMVVPTTIKSRTVLTNTPSATTVKKGTTTVIRGLLRRFDGAPIAGQRVLVRVVPAGWTKGSYAGAARTTSTGAFALTVRAYYTGSWFVNYPGNVTALPTYKAAWVRVTR